MAERRDEGHGFPVAVGNLGDQPFPAPRPSPKRLHIGFRPGFIDEDETIGINLV
jgi:hypothetical protein